MVDVKAFDEGTQRYIILCFFLAMEEMISSPFRVMDFSNISVGTSEYLLSLLFSK